MVISFKFCCCVGLHFIVVPVIVSTPGLNISFTKVVFIGGLFYLDCIILYRRCNIIMSAPSLRNDAT